jgi:hypothetical protein
MEKDFSPSVCLSRLAIVILTLLVLSFSGCVNGGAGTTEIPTNQSDGNVNVGITEIPVNLSGAINVGSLHIEVVYDSSILEITAVKAGKLAQNALVDSTITTPGRAIIGILSSNGISGSGAIASIDFKSKAKAGTSALTLEKVEAYSADKLQAIRTQVSAGEFNAKDSSFNAPSISF